jgi:hypothetical protein
MSLVVETILAPMNLEATFHAVVDLTNDNEKIPNQEPEDCPICLCETAKSEQSIINGCGHMICKTCEPNTRKTQQTKDRENLLPVLKCPMCRQPEEPSAEQLKDRIRYLNVKVTNLNSMKTELSRQLARREDAETLEDAYIIPFMKEQLRLFRIQLTANGLTPMPSIERLEESINHMSEVLRPPEQLRPRATTTAVPANVTRVIPPQHHRRQPHRREQPTGTTLERCCGFCQSPRRTRSRCASGCGAHCCRSCRYCNACRRPAANANATTNANAV